jgi:hypothetical protein
MDGNVRQQAEAHGPVGHAMVARRAAKGIGIGDLAGKDIRDGMGGKACRQQGNSMRPC